MRFLDMALQWFYPPRCVLCGKLLKIGQENGICNECQSMTLWKEGAVCQKCGCNIYDNEEYCERCKKADFVFEKGIAVFSYNEAKRAIAHFKFHYWKRDALPLGKIMGDYLLTYYPEWKEEAELFVPVPMYNKKQQKRGFNQSELLAEVIAKRIGKSCSTTLKRIRSTTPQSLLDTEQRRKNIIGAFAVENPEEIQDKVIILIDDVFTTGVTVNECAKVLYQNGAKKVMFFGLSVAEGV